MKVCLQGSDQVSSHIRNNKKNWDNLTYSEKTRAGGETEKLPFNLWGAVF